MSPLCEEDHESIFLHVMNSELSKQKSEFRKTYAHPHELDSFPYFVDDTDGDTDKCDFFILCNKICQQDHDFPSDLHTQLQNRALVKRIHSEGKTDQRTLTWEHESVLLLTSDSTLHLNIKKLPTVCQVLV